MRIFAETRTLTRHPSSFRCERATRVYGYLLKASVLVLALAILAGCSKKSAEPAKPTEQQTEKKEPESRVTRDTNGNVVVTLDAATQKIIGLQVAPLKAISLDPERKAYGRVLDVSGLAAAVTDLATAQAASQASHAELDRIKILAAQTNASTRALQAAEAAAVHDQSQVEALRLRLVASWGTTLSSRSDLPAFVQALGNLSSALIQLEVPAGETLQQPPTGARVLSLSNQTQPVTAEFLGPAPAVDPQMQGRGFLFLVPSNSLGLAPGAAVTGFLKSPGEAQSGVAVPSPALIRYNGATWIYLQTSEEKFQRTEVHLETPVEGGWFIRQGLKPEDKAVTAGAQQLLSQELKGSD